MSEEIIKEVKSSFLRWERGVLTGKFKVGDTAFIVESNRFIREAEVRSCTGCIYLIKFKDNGGGIKLKEHRLFASKEKAETSIPKAKLKYRSPYE